MVAVLLYHLDLVESEVKSSVLGALQRGRETQSGARPVDLCGAGEEASIVEGGA